VKYVRCFKLQIILQERRIKMKNEKFKAIAVNVYAGGFSLGVKGSGIDVIAHFEDEKPYGEEVINMNRGNIWGALPIIPYHTKWQNCPDIDLFFSNPPCAPFSNANTNSFNGGWKNDKRLSCWDRIVNWGILNRPKIIVIETTIQAYSKAPDFLMEVSKKFINIGFGVTIFLNNACYFGSAQNRPRILLIASPFKLNFKEYFSTPSVSTGILFNFFSEELSNIPKDKDYPFPVNPKLVNLLKEIKPGERMAATFNRLTPIEDRIINSKGQVKGRPTFGIVKLHPDKLSSVIVGYPLVHPWHQRFLTLKEYQLLGDFPLDYNFPLAVKSNSYIARGVSSKVGNWLGSMAKMTLRNRMSVRMPCVEIVNGLHGYKNQKSYDIVNGDIAKMTSQVPKLSLRSSSIVNLPIDEVF